MGRPERPVDPTAGPVQRLAYELRELRRAAGNPSYRTMEKTAGFSVTTLAQAAGGQRLPSLAAVQGYVRACGADPAAWEPRWQETAAEVAGTPRDDADAIPPYRGLTRFEPGDRELFFGRDRLIEELHALACENRFAVVFGASGSGKSSLLRAGLVPRLREEAERHGRPAVLRMFTPGPRPAATYGHLLAPADGEPESWVVVDQFEEVFTLCRDRAERGRFLDLLLAARAPGSRLRVLIAVRADFYARFGEHRELAQAVRCAALLVGPMSAEELREAVVRPAQAAGLVVERELTARIVEDVLEEPGGLPMLSHALLETWRRRKGRMLTLATYESAGGVRGAIAASAEDVYGELSEAQARFARHLLLRLIEPGQGDADTRRPLTRSELAEWPDLEVQPVVERLARARLLTVDEDGVQLAHEALITCWPRLCGWIEEHRDRLRHHRRLTEAATAWIEHGRDPSMLYAGTRLAHAEELFQSDEDWYAGLTTLERSFLFAAARQRAAQQQAAARSRRRGRTLVTALSAVLAVALVVGLAAWRLAEVSQRQRVDAAARRVAEVADALRSTDPRTAMLLGAAAWEISPLPESRAALLSSLAQPQPTTFTDPEPGTGSARFLVGSGRTLLSTDGRTWRTWDVVRGRRTASGELPGGAVIAAAPDARTLLIKMASGAQRLWDTRAARWVGVPAPAGTTATFSASGRSYLVSGPDDRVRLYSFTDGKLLFQTPVAGVMHATVDASDRQVAVCPTGQTPQVWDIARHRPLPGTWQSTTGICGDPRTSLILAGQHLVALTKNDVRVWDTTSGRLLAALPEPGAAQAALSADGNFLATTDSQEVRLWRLSAPGAPVFRYNRGDGKPPNGFAWDPEHPFLRCLVGGTVHTLDLTRTVTPAWRAQPLTAVRLAPNGRTLATAERIGTTYVFQLRDARDGHVLSTLPPSPLPASPDRRHPVVGADTVPLLAFDPEGNTLAYGVSAPGRTTASQRLTVWDVSADQPRSTVDLATAQSAPAVVAIALGPGGRTLHTVRTAVPGAADYETWDIAGQRRTAVLPGQVGAHLAVSPGGLVVTDNGVISAGRTVTYDLVQNDAIGALAFAPDGSRLAAGDQSGHVALWTDRLQQRTGILRNVFPPPGDIAARSPEAVSALAFSPDGRTLAVGGDAGTLQLWDTATQQPLGSPLPTPGERIDTLAFSTDSGTLYAGSAHVPLQRYVVDPARVVSDICARSGGSGLTPAQWHTYVPDAPYHRVCA
ncbi:hypothetical protein [Streptomyces arenae]|uniref:nSTAND1 domain-containing NTPase n=1 Tax=Streptomyces arenae TaxID=29301 RepID=UPI0026586206|nr:hypothetical protein [Streptomyces arenae]MCG7207361.1 AAA family ATPase [Streptomyces arenae]